MLAASKHGNWQAARKLIARRAKELGVDLASLPGFGDSDGTSKPTTEQRLVAAREPFPAHTLTVTGAAARLRAIELDEALMQRCESAARVDEVYQRREMWLAEEARR